MTATTVTPIGGLTPDLDLRGLRRFTTAVNDTFAQLRIGAQALRGISAVHSSEWACGA